MPYLYRECHALANYDDKFVYATGGREHVVNGGGVRSVERLSIVFRRWEQVQPMNIGRSLHGSCALGNSIYVFCGLTSFMKHTNSIEKLVVDGPYARWEKWELIEFPLNTFPVNRSFNCAALNSHEIVLLGGVFVDGEFAELNQDVYVFDTRTKTTSKMG